MNEKKDKRDSEYTISPNSTAEGFFFVECKETRGYFMFSENIVLKRY